MFNKSNIISLKTYSDKYTILLYLWYILYINNHTFKLHTLISEKLLDLIFFAGVYSNKLSNNILLLI